MTTAFRSVTWYILVDAITLSLLVLNPQHIVVSAAMDTVTRPPEAAWSIASNM